MLKRKLKNVKLEKFNLVKKLKTIQDDQEFIKKQYKEKLNALNLQKNLYLEKLSTCQKHKKQILNVLNNEIEATLFEYLPSCIVRIIKAYTLWESCNSCGSLFPREFKCLPCYKKSHLNNFRNGHLNSFELEWKTKGLVTNDMKFFCQDDELIAHYLNLFVLKPNLSIRTSKRIFFIFIEFDYTSKNWR